MEFHILLHASGGVPPYLWSVASGDLPEGITLTPEGLLAGRPAKPGGFTFTLKVEDSAVPRTPSTKISMSRSPLPCCLNGFNLQKCATTGLTASVQVSNGSKDVFDLTVIIVAVAENGRATAIGYEHFPLKAGVADVQIPVGNTLPHGGYEIHADAIAEIPARNTILRQRLQSPTAFASRRGSLAFFALKVRKSLAVSVLS